jgi:hypothetical protein
MFSSAASNTTKLSNLPVELTNLWCFSEMCKCIFTW